MPSLVAPSGLLRESFLAAVAQYQREGRYTELDVSALAAPTAFAAYLQELAAEALPDRRRRASVVAQTTLWWVDGAVFLGRVSIRHRLTNRLRQVGGHIGYDVAPSARRRGHAAAMLRAALPVAAELGIDPALVTCDVDNVASRKVIEGNGGRLFQAGDGKMRFWVPTGRRVSTRLADDWTPDASTASASAGVTLPGREGLDAIC
jgi:predicted acetyltransferase